VEHEVIAHRGLEGVDIDAVRHALAHTHARTWR
jgi:hypothetical protein